MPKKNKGLREYPNINIRLHPATHEKLKLMASLQGITMMEIVSNAVNIYLTATNFDGLLQDRINKIDKIKS